MDTKNDKSHFKFRAVEKTDEALIYAWMTQEHVSEWVHGECLKRTLFDI